ncbi:hypothetical protein ACFLXC_02295 [Chloroflexota bacterium]
MVITASRKLAAILLVAGLLSVVLGGVFIAQGFAKSSLITLAMTDEKIQYNAADGSIIGVIDTPQEALTMSNVLKDHRLTNYGIYSELGRDDPNRDQILKAMTMENSLNLAQMGYGLTDVVKISGVWMVVIGLTFATMGGAGLRSRNKILLPPKE